MASSLNEKEFEIKLKWQDFKKYYVAIYLLIIALTPLTFLIRWLTSQMLKDLFIYITVFIIFASLVVFPVFMFRRSKQAPILNSKLIAKSLIMLITSWFFGVISLYGLIDLIITIKHKSPYEFFIDKILSSPADITVIYVIILVINFLVLFPISFLLNKYFPWELPNKNKKEAK